jgi:CHASE2 domain-containing sensor protein
MSNLPQPVWAIVLAALGVIMAIIALFRPSPENICLAVLAIASNLVSGALGAFAGHASKSETKPPA